MIYLDNNATTLIDPRVADHMFQLNRARLANPSSQHAAGRKARLVIEQAREELLVACDGRAHGIASDQILLTSGGTESNNMAIFGLAANRPGRIIVSGIEHSSVLAAAQMLESRGREVRYLPSCASGIVAMDLLRDWIRQDPIGTACVSVMYANNETGVIQPVQEIGSLCRDACVPFHIDAVQGFCKIPMSFQDVHADAMTVTSHKLHGPLGVGALVLRHGVSIPPQLFGGAQQLGLRPGTETPVLAAGFACAVAFARAELLERARRVQALRDRMEAALHQVGHPILVIGEKSPRLPHTSCISFLGQDRQAIQIALDQQQIACSSGSACASGSSQPSHVLQAMGMDAVAVTGAVRFSLSWETTEEEIDFAVGAIKHVLDRLTKR